MIERRAELISAAVLAALGLAMCLYSIAEYSFTSESSIGPGVLPVISGGLLIVSASAVALAALRRQPSVEVRREPAAESPDGGLPSATQLAMRVLGLCVVAALLTSVVGFVLAFSALVFAVIVLVERKPVLVALAAAVGGGVVTWSVFVYLLKIPLPTGLL